MLGYKSTSLNAIIRTANRKQELQMLVEELTRARGSSIPSGLAVRARRLSELGHSEFEMVCVLRAHQRCFHADRANAMYCSRHLRLLPSHTWRCTCPQLEANQERYLSGVGRAKDEHGLASSADASSAFHCGVRFVQPPTSSGQHTLAPH
jgi:hypothetical protein